jgi:predicted dehydrogenase
MNFPITLDTTGPVFPRTEWFVRLTDSEAATRLPSQLKVVSPISELTPRDGDRILGRVNIGFTDRPVLIVRPDGDGTRVISGIDPDAIAAVPELVTYLSRAVGGRSTVDTLAVGVIGYGPFGGMGYTHGLACTETDGLAFVAAVDTSDERRKAAESDFPGVQTYADVSEMIDEGGVDLAIVATPPVYHAPIARDLLEHGIHAVVEKPMCIETADADRLISLAKKQDLLVTVHQSRRWDPDYLALRSVIESGRIGDVFNVETFVGGSGHPCRAWHSEESISGGAIYDWGSHHVDWIIQLYGSMPATIRCVGHKRVWHDVTNLDQLTLHMMWPDGREATFRQSDIAAIRRPKFYVQGDSGTLEGHYRPLVHERLEPGRGFVREESHHAEAPVDLEVRSFDGSTSIVGPTERPGWGFHVNLADHLLLGEPLAVTPQSTRDVVRVLEAGHRSASEGGSVITLD